MKRAAIVSPIRTAVGKYLGALSDIPAGQLGAVVLKDLVARTKIDPARIDDADWGGLISPRARRRRHDAERAAA